MAVEFYDLNEKAKKTILFSLNDEDFEKLQPVLFQFKKLTGLTIDQYGNSRLHAEHVQLIVELLEKTLSDLKPNNHLFELIEKFKNNKCDLLAIGD